MGEHVDANEPVDVVRELSRRFQAGDREGAFALFHPDIRIVQPVSLPHGGVHEGHAGVVDMGTRFAEHWDRTIADPRIVGGDDGETVAQVTTQTWTAKATGVDATVDVVALLTVADGLVTEIRVFPQDTRLLLSTLPPLD
jgi:uncharacterized protein